LTKESKKDPAHEAYDMSDVQHKEVQKPSEINLEDQKTLREVGTVFEDEELDQGRTASFLQFDQSVVNIQNRMDKLEVMPITKALKKYDWLREKYFWKAVSSQKDDITQTVDKFPTEGYFIRALPGYKSGEKPVQACLYLTKENSVQRVHNIVIAEEGAELNVLSGCASAHSANQGAHYGISEFYVKKDAKISFTMIHSWGENVVVKPRSAAIVEENGEFVSNYVTLKSVRHIETYPKATLAKDATARFYSVAAAYPGNVIDIGSAAELNGKGASCDIISRTVSHGGKIIARGRLIANEEQTHGHLECQGLMLEPDGSIVAIPELDGNVQDSELTHEAAVGKVAQEKVDYLRSRGLTEAEATAAIVTGFLNLEIQGLPTDLRKKIEKAVESYGKNMF